MARDGLDITELDSFSKNMLSIAEEKMPRASKSFLKKEGGKLNRVNKKTFATMGIGEDTGNLRESFKRGKLYNYKGKHLAIRAYNSSPHAHLLNDGWTWKPHEGQTGNEKFIAGWHFIEEAEKDFTGTFFNDTEKFIDDLIDKGL